VAKSVGALVLTTSDELIGQLIGLDHGKSDSQTVGMTVGTSVKEFGELKFGESVGAPVGNPSV